MNSKEIETAVIEVLGRLSVCEVLAAQYYMFLAENGTHPRLIQVNRKLQPAYLREMARVTGLSVDELAHYATYGIELARIQFVGAGDSFYVSSFAPGKEPMTL